MKNKILKLLYFVRGFWAVPIGLWYRIYWTFQIVFIPASKNRFQINKLAWDICQNHTDLNAYFKIWSYKWDGPKGIADHDNSDAEFFASGGDCDDVAIMVYRQLKKFKLKPKLILIQGNDDIFHFDTYFKVNGSCFLFNYGQNIIGCELSGCMNNLKTIYKWETIQYAVVK